MTKYITISGKKQTGKSLSAELLQDYLYDNGYSTRVVSFADPLKAMCVEILGLTSGGVYGTDKEKNELCHIMWDGLPMEIRLKYSNNHILAGDGIQDPLPRSGPMTNREVLQVIGTDIFRALYHDVWALAPFRREWGEYDYVIIADCRYPNEVEATLKHKGIVLRLERETGLVDTHVSENALDNYKFENVYSNNGTIEDLNKFLKGFIDGKQF